MDKVCRLCLQLQSAMSPIFTKDKEVPELWLQIIDCCSIEVLENDVLPKLICDCCKAKLVSAYDFRKQCKESDLRLRRYYQIKTNKYFNQRKNTNMHNAYVQTEMIELPLPITQTRFLNNEESNNERQSPMEDLDISTDQTDHDKCDIAVEPSSRKENTHKVEMFIANTKEISQKENSMEENPSNDVTKKETFLCNICDKVYASKKTLTKHAKCHTNNDTFAHVPNIDTLPDKEIASSKDLECNVGNISYTDQEKVNSRLHMHDLPVKPEIQYLCDICSKTFVSNSGLRFHLKSHDGSKPHLCKYCNKSFVIPSYKNRHERTHTGDKHFICHICSAAFASSNGLKYHLRTHTGEANYHCKTCGKSFRRYKYLKEHIFTHTGERPFACKICGLAYSNSGSLFVHEKKCKSRFARVAGSLIKPEQQAGGNETVREEVPS